MITNTEFFELCKKFAKQYLTPEFKNGFVEACNKASKSGGGGDC